MRFSSESSNHNSDPFTHVARCMVKREASRVLAPWTPRQLEVIRRSGSGNVSVAPPLNGSDLSLTTRNRSDLI